ncbi:MAG TPA: hypothetical protein PKA64_02335 [Myxococcota bacterium]|nr:hypothetical protein [Myxococcota bacterium]
MGRVLLSALLVTSACTGNPSTDDPSTDDPTKPTLLRDCDQVEGDICPFAGAGSNGFNGDGKDKFDTFFSFPMSVAFSEYGLPVIADWNNHKLREINADGTVTTIMGTFLLGDGDPSKLDLTTGAQGTTVNLNHPTMQVWLSDGTLMSASWHTHKLRTWDPDTGLVHVVLGNTPGMAPPEPMDDRGAPVADDGCQLNQPKEIRLDADENVYIVDMRNERIRFWDREAGTIQTIAGKGDKTYCGEGPALETCFNFPKNANPEPGGSLALTPDGAAIYIADTESNIIRKLDLTTMTTSLVAGQPGVAGFADGPGASALFDFPTDIELDGDTLFVADANNHRIRTVDVTTGEVSTFAGNGEPTCADGIHQSAGDSGLTVVPVVCDEQVTGGDGGPATDATLYRPMGIDLDLDGNVVIADTYNHRFRVVYR